MNTANHPCSKDILLKNELDQIQNNHPEQFSVRIYYVLNNPPKEWDGGAGFVTKQMIADKLPSAKLANQVKILLCGPPPMTAIMKKYLEELDFEKCRVISKIDDQVFCTSHFFF
ncbi:nitrate reductase (NADH) [Puccinia sorghi]|uniref:Nitrate reductase (NADH) n=1 Tax=Puccinia sorghi TaxID=27349 RepID=A0A0L6U7H7_9BASI|nr:nitrate reductase (NADH) [Puccinia sorghi]